MTGIGHSAGASSVVIDWLCHRNSPNQIFRTLSLYFKVPRSRHVFRQENFFFSRAAAKKLAQHASYFYASGRQSKCGATRDKYSATVAYLTELDADVRRWRQAFKWLQVLARAPKSADKYCNEMVQETWAENCNDKRPLCRWIDVYSDTVARTDHVDAIFKERLPACCMI